MVVAYRYQLTDYGFSASTFLLSASAHTLTASRCTQNDPGMSFQQILAKLAIPPDPGVGLESAIDVNEAAPTAEAVGLFIPRPITQVVTKGKAFDVFRVSLNMSQPELLDINRPQLDPIGVQDISECTAIRDRVVDHQVAWSNLTASDKAFHKFFKLL